MSEINPAIFKAYDIRGIYPTELNDDAAYAIGRAFALHAATDHIVVGSDMRLSGPALKVAFIRGVTDEGVNVVDIGLVSIDAVYFCVYKLHHPAAVMITASHNPKEYNGFKMVLADMQWVRGEELRDSALSLQPDVRGGGTVTALDIWAEYINHVVSFCQPEKIKPLKVVIDAGNGMAGKVIPQLAPRLPITVVPLNFELDGNFPAHPSNPLMPESQVEISRTVKETKADVGVIFDGDTDRLFFVDETGAFIRADRTLLILAREFLNREPGAGIVYNAICSKMVPEKITAWGGVALRSKVGFVNVSSLMRQRQGIMGGELSAHYSFRDNGWADSGFIAFVILLQLISQDGRPLSTIVEEFNHYFKSDEINLEVDDRATVIAALRSHFADGQQDELDGLTVTYSDWWFNVRPSNTEPLLRLTIEADTAAVLEEKKQALTAFITSSIHS